MGAFNGVTAGFSDELKGGLAALGGGDYTQARDAADAQKRALAELHPYADFAGNIAGGALAMAAPSAGIARLGLGAGKLLSPGAIALDAGYGGLYGAGQENQNRLGGAVSGAIGGAVGGLAGRALAIPLASGARSLASRGMAFRGFAGQGATPPTALTPADAAYLDTAQKAGLPDIQARFAQAQRLGVPMAPADVHPSLTSLAGAAVRRSPNAEAIARANLEPRSAGQLDRFGNAVQRDLGTLGDTAQMSQSLMDQAKAAAALKYPQAYAAPIPSTPELSSLLETPFGREAIAKAHTIAANERVSPTELGFAQDAQGNTVLNPQPNQLMANHLGARAELDAAQEAYRAARNGTGDLTAARTRVVMARDSLRSAEKALGGAPDPTQAANVPTYTTRSLDYAKQGMDDVLEQYRNGFGKLELGPGGRAQNGVKNSLLSEMDRHNPAYADARSVYAGPMQSRDALSLGRDAVGMRPNDLGVGMADKSPEQVSQAQLGFRSELVDKAGDYRNSSNPFNTVLGTPNMEQRLDVMYPGNPGNANLLAQRDMEAGLARTSNKVLGGSDTAQRGIADQAFRLAALPSLGIDAGLMAMGHPPLATAGLIGAKGITAAVQRALESRAVAKADAIAPTLFNTDPAAASAALSDFANQSQLYRDYVTRSRQSVARPLGMFGGSAGAYALAS